MKRLFLFIASIAVASAAGPVAIQRQDIVGTWIDTGCIPYDGNYTFGDDGIFAWHCEDQIDGGKWLFRPPGKIELISYGDWTKPAITKASVHHFIQIEGFARHRMVIR